MNKQKHRKTQTHKGVACLRQTTSPPPSIGQIQNLHMSKAENWGKDWKPHTDTDTTGASAHPHAPFKRLTKHPSDQLDKPADCTASARWKMTGE